MKDNQINITISGKINSGKTRVTYLLKKLLRQEGFDVEFSGNIDHPNETEFDEHTKKNFNVCISSIKERSGINIILKEEEQENKISMSRLILQSNIGYLDDKMFRNRYNDVENIGFDYYNCDIKYELISYNEDSKILKLKTKK